MTTCIVGYQGNMGRRYCAILDMLGKKWIGVDLDINQERGFIAIPPADNYIIATPTSVHISSIISCKMVNPEAEILCEKPITTEIDRFNNIHKDYWDSVFMVNQYQYYPNLEILACGGGTSYNFYHSGNDGIAWDCIQLIHLDYGNYPKILKNESPIWRAQINGVVLNKSVLDQCYVDMIEDFLGFGDFLWNLHEAYEAHEEVLEFLEVQKGE